MKKIIIISLCLLFANITKGQEYIPMPTDSAEWVTCSSYSDGISTTTSCGSGLISGDTIINNKVFKKYCAKNSNSVISYLYFEEKKVYWLNNINSLQSNQVKNDTVVRLLYDFGIIPGDTIYYPWYWEQDTLIENGAAYVLDTIINTTTNIDVRKKYVFKSISLGYIGVGFDWIEGIGSSISLCFLYHQEAFRVPYGIGGSHLSCFIYKGIEILGSNCSVLSVNDKVSNDKIELYPNPFVDNFQMIIPEDFSPYGFSIYDINGKIIKSESISEFDKTISINANTIKKGTYFIVLSDNNGNTLKKVVVKQ